MQNYECTEERFLRDVEDHEMTVIRDDGFHRHIRFKQPNTICYYFDLITWPGHLCISGDCGTYVFSRVEDMFTFFRKDHKPKEGTLAINPRYWGEKLLSIGTNAGYKEYDEEALRAQVKDYFDQHFQEEIEEEASIRADYTDEDPPADETNTQLQEQAARRADIWQAIEDEILSLSDGEHRACYALYDFNHDDFHFEDFFERGLTRYTFHFIWCLYAIVWGVKKYDEAKVPVPAEQAA